MRRILTAAVSVAAAVVLAGCQNPPPGTAAVIDGERITEQELADAASAYTDLTGQPLSPADMISVLALDTPVTVVAEELGMTITDTETVNLIETVMEDQGIQAPDEGYPQTLIDLVRISELAAPINQAAQQGTPEPFDEVGRLLQDVDVELNPRYGTWAQGSVVPNQHDWIAVEPVSEVAPEMPTP